MTFVARPSALHCIYTACSLVCQYCLGGNFWLCTYRRQRLRAWPALILRRVVGFTKVSRSRNSCSRPEFCIFFLNLRIARSTWPSCTITVLPVNFNAVSFHCLGSIYQILADDNSIYALITILAYVIHVRHQCAFHLGMQGPGTCS